MKFKSRANPVVGKGLLIEAPKMTVPDQAYSLKEILERFTRNEALPIGKQAFDGAEGASDEQLLDRGVDMEKLRVSDLTEKDEYIANEKALQERYNAQERAKAAKKAEAAKAAERAEIEAQLRKELEKSKAMG